MAALLLLIFIPLWACDAPGPLKAERAAEDLFGPSEDQVVVVDAILLVDAPLPPVDLRRTVAPGLDYAREATALVGAQVAILQGENIYVYRPDPSIAGRYLPPVGAPLVAPGTIYELRVSAGEDPPVRATTQTPGRLRIAELVLLDDDLEEELRRLHLFGAGDETVYEVAENQLEYTVGTLEIRLQEDTGAASYQFGIRNLEEASPLLFSADLLDDEDVEDLERQETSRLLRLEEGALYLPWEGIFYAGRHKVKLFAVDHNWFDLVRTDNIDSERESGEAGQGFQRPLFNVENGIGLFASAAVDSVGFFVRSEGTPSCSGCECWGCGDRSSWSGLLDLDTGMGRLRFERDVGTGATCELSFEIAAAVPVECPDCAFAREFELGELTLYRDGGACEEAEELQGQRFRFGQGKEVVAEEGGAPHYSLLIDVEGFWAQLETGWSIIVAEGAPMGLWLFGFIEE
ncbi:MAG: DUF4249 family protein [Candidatus Latescibacteria bacterium]|nr:DUF4249 family protein [Candidatus Latescibacterota bacterium]